MFFQFLLLCFFINLTVVSSASCPSEATEWNSFCYFFNSTQVQFAKAEIECSKKLGGHLASISDGYTNAILVGAQDFHESTVTDFWIGGTTLAHPPFWSWTDGSAFNFTEWAPTEPSNITAEACLALSITNGFWLAQDCFKLKPYVCAVPKIPDPPAFEKCPLGWIYFQPSHSCFGISYTQQNTPLIYNWGMAEQHCAQLGGHLPSFHSVDEFNIINSFVMVSVSPFWIGLRSNDGGASWRWSDNTDVNYLPPWHTGFPKPMGESCVWQQLGDTANLECGTPQYFICKKPAS